MMDKKKFCELLKAELNEEMEILEDTNFKELDSFGSLSSVLILQLVETHLSVKLNPRSFRKIKTVNEIFDAITA